VASTSLAATQERAWLDAARHGDESAFRRIVEEHRTELHAHCYRMLGSLHDAEDVLQETLLRLWRGLPGFDGRSSVRTWVYRIATNACLDAIARRPKRVLPIDHGPPSAPGPVVDAPLVEGAWVEPYPDEPLGLSTGHASPAARYEQREAVELAFIAALQHLPAKQRAVLIMREVLGFSAREVAESLQTTRASVNSALQRARRSVDERVPERSQQETLRLLGDERATEIVNGYVDAWMKGDVEALQRLLTDDVVFSMPPWVTWWRGRDTLVEIALAGRESCPPSRTMLTRANGQLAVAHYALEAETASYAAAAIDVFTLDGEAIAAITAFVMPELFRDFGLAAELAAGDAFAAAGRAS
jgi:RNA polymerase sigma-70 factor (ECF subfamily)